MKFGQRYNGKGRISSLANYVQFNICGLSAIEIVQRYFIYEIDKPIVLLGDYSSEERDAREDDMLQAERIYEIKDAISSLQAFGAEIWAITLQPVSRFGLSLLGSSNISFEEFSSKLNDIYPVPVLFKNRGNKDLYLSNPEEIIEFSQNNKITLDFTHLLEACKYDFELYKSTLFKINIENVQELHIKQLSLQDENKLPNTENWTELDSKKVIEYLKNVPWVTFTFMEQGGGHNRFEHVVKIITGTSNFL